MKILVDACVSAGVPRALVEAGYDVVYVADWPSDPGDVEILENAHQGARILVALDKDFGELAIVRGLAHSGIVRLVALSISKQVEVCLSALARYGALLESGAIVTAEAGRVRVRPPDERE